MSLQDFYNATETIYISQLDNEEEQEASTEFLAPFLLQFTNMLEIEGAIYEIDNSDPEEDNRQSLQLKIQ